jgi:hypothetical protein
MAMPSQMAEEARLMRYCPVLDPADAPILRRLVASARSRALESAILNTKIARVAAGRNGHRARIPIDRSPAARSIQPGSAPLSRSTSRFSSQRTALISLHPPVPRAIHDESHLIGRSDGYARQCCPLSDDFRFRCGSARL